MIFEAKAMFPAVNSENDALLRGECSPHNATAGNVCGPSKCFLAGPTPEGPRGSWWLNRFSLIAVLEGLTKAMSERKTSLCITVHRDTSHVVQKA